MPYTSDINVLDAVAKGLNVGENISWRIDVYSVNRGGNASIKHEHFTDLPESWSFKFRSPFSVDIDNNPNSPYFGRMYVTQMMWYDKNGDGANDYSRGIYVYGNNLKRIGMYMGNGLESATEHGWYGATHGVPHMVRVIQDGTGRLLVSSSDRSQATHLWLVKNASTDGSPNPIQTWTPVITSSQLRDWTVADGHKHTSSTNFANVSVDIRENGDNFDILLYSGTVDAKTTNQSLGHAYSGVYTVSKSSTDLTGGTYTPYTGSHWGKNSAGTYTFISHPTVSNTYSGSMFTANATFDSYGGVLYSSYKVGADAGATSSALIHRDVNGEFKTDYADVDYLKRQSTASKGCRFNKDFTKLAIAQGALSNEIRIYKVNHTSANSNLTLSEGVSVDLMADNTKKDGSGNACAAYIHDIAWDYASNVFACVRNQANINGIYVVATDLNGAPTPTAGNNTFRINCPDGGPFAITVNGQVEGKNINVDLSDCKLQIDATNANWGTSKSVASCNIITIKAIKDNRHKFLGWYEGSNLLTDSDECTIVATKNVTVTAKFEFAEYTGMKWYNLFQDGEDICSPTHDGTRNARLWYLFMPYYNQYCKSNNITQRELAKTLSNDNNNYDISTFCSSETNKVLTDPNQMKWLGDYFKSYITAVSWINVDYNRCMYAFINRVSYAKNSGGGYQYKDNDKFQSDGLIAQLKVFSSTGTTKAADTAVWRPYWTKHACELPDILTYNDPMPITWNQIPGPNGTTYDTYTTALPTTVGLKLTNTPKWYKWNTGGANQLLAWRNGGTDYKKYPIVHHVTTDNMALYATYVDKHIHENDPAVSGQNDATNEDVIKLLANPKYKEAGQKHTLTVTRKLQPGMYNTLCLPFGVDINSLANDHPLKNADVRKLTTVTKELYAESGESVMVLNFEQVTTTEPGKPYLVKLANGKQATETLTFSGVYCSDYDALQPDSDNEGLFTFHPTYDPIDIPAGAIILVADNRLALTTESGRMEGLRGYFTINPELMSADDIQEKAQSGRIYLSMNAPSTTSVPLAPDAEKQEAPKAQTHYSLLRTK